MIVFPKGFTQEVDIGFSKFHNLGADNSNQYQLQTGAVSAGNSLRPPQFVIVTQSNKYSFPV